MAPYPDYHPPIGPKQWADYTYSHKLADRWGVLHSTIVRLFDSKPGVLRAYVTDKAGVQHTSLLIPEKTARAVRVKLWAFLAPSIDRLERV